MQYKMAFQFDPSLRESYFKEQIRTTTDEKADHEAPGGKHFGQRTVGNVSYGAMKVSIILKSETF